MFSNKKILIVDHEIAAARRISTSLQRSGHYDVRRSHNVRQCLAIARRFQPNVVLISAALPQISGHELAAQLKAEQGIAASRIVFLTAGVKQAIMN